MPSAARVTDLSNHGGTLIGPGEPTVLIGGMMAARLGDLTVHGGVIVVGNPTGQPLSDGQRHRADRRQTGPAGGRRLRVRRRGGGGRTHGHHRMKQP